jgi:hypothetical protein
MDLLFESHQYKYYEIYFYLFDSSSKDHSLIHMKYEGLKDY